jgi:hypothetical protein
VKCLTQPIPLHHEQPPGKLGQVLQLLGHLPSAEQSLPKLRLKNKDKGKLIDKDSPT